MTAQSKQEERTVFWYSDPAHGWMAVDRADLKTLGIAEEVSVFSYSNGTTVFLEEDCDAALYLRAAEKAGWNITQFDHGHSGLSSLTGESRIRSYDSYRAGAA